MRSRPGIGAHASLSLRPEDLTNASGIPCTSVARTLLDLADVVPRRQIERAVEQAQVLRVFDLTQVRDPPRPAVNQWIALDEGPPIRPDFHWSRERLIVEMDGRDVLRFTHRQLSSERTRVTATVEAMLNRT